MSVTYEKTIPLERLQDAFDQAKADGVSHLVVAQKQTFYEHGVVISMDAYSLDKDDLVYGLAQIFKSSGHPYPDEVIEMGETLEESRRGNLEILPSRDVTNAIIQHTRDKTLENYRRRLDGMGLMSRVKAEWPDYGHEKNVAEEEAKRARGWKPKPKGDEPSEWDPS